MAWRFNLGFKLGFETPGRDLRHLLVRISPVSILAGIFGVSSLFLTWLVESQACGWPDCYTDGSPEFTRVLKHGLLDTYILGPQTSADTIMVYLIVIGSFAVLFTFAAVIPLVSGLLIVLSRNWDYLDGFKTVGDSVWALSLGLGFYLCLTACILGAASAVPRIAPAIVPRRNDKS